MPAVILENIRSSYNVWNIIRTADAFGFDVIISGYTPSPNKDLSVCKTSLWAEKNVKIYEFWNTKEAIEFAKQKFWFVIAAEIINNSQNILKLNKIDFQNISIVFGNEVEWVLEETLEMVDWIYYIPMIWKKESLNVGQASAIFMWEVFKNIF